MEIVPVRRDGTGRLVAVGLIEVMDTDGVQRWTTIHAAEVPGESRDDTIDRGIGDTLGAGAHGRPSKPPASWPDQDRSEGPGIASGAATAQAVEISGRFEPQGGALRFSWFLVTALPAHEEIRPDQRLVIADFLEAQGEPGLAGRLRQF